MRFMATQTFTDPLHPYTEIHEKWRKNTFVLVPTLLLLGKWRTTTPRYGPCIEGTRQTQQGSEYEHRVHGNSWISGNPLILTRRCMDGFDAHMLPHYAELRSWNDRTQHSPDKRCPRAMIVVVHVTFFLGWLTALRNSCESPPESSGRWWIKALLLA